MKTRFNLDAFSIKFWPVLALFFVILTGCEGFKPEPIADNSDIPPGRGLLTGPSGEFKITFPRSASTQQESSEVDSKPEDKAEQPS